LDVLRLALEHGCPWDADFVRAAAAAGGPHEVLRRWLDEHGDRKVLKYLVACITGMF